MKDEKKYILKLIAELKRFFTFEEEEEREAVALEICVKLQLTEEDEENMSKETGEISASLALLEDYASDPAVYDEMMGQILVDAELQLKKLEKENASEELTVKLIEEDQEED